MAVLPWQPAFVYLLLPNFPSPFALSRGQGQVRREGKLLAKFGCVCVFWLPFILKKTVRVGGEGNAFNCKCPIKAFILVSPVVIFGNVASQPETQLQGLNAWGVRSSDPVAAGRRMEHR